MLVKIVNTLQNHSSVQNQILSTFNEELKIRPTYSEIIGFVAKKSEPEIVDKTYIALDILENVSNELGRKFEITAGINREQVEDHAKKLKYFKDTTIENFRNLSKKVGKHSEDRKNVVKLIRNWKVRQRTREKARLIFTSWKRRVQNQDKSKKLLKKIILEKDFSRQKRAWNRLKGAYLLVRMKKFEGNSVRALLRADDCQSKLFMILPEIISLKQNKANADDLVKVASAVQRTNYESVYKDLVGMIKEESQSLQQQLQKINQEMSQQIQTFCRDFTENSENASSRNVLKEISMLRTDLNSLQNMQDLIKEQVSRIDYCNRKENNEFKLEVLTKQLKQLETKMLSISCSQDTIADQTVYLRSMLQFNKPSSKTSMKPSSTPATKAIHGDISGVSQLLDSDLSVSGVYLRPNKRVSSASPGKKRVHSQQRKHRIPTSFSSTLSITETPLFFINK